ncbi:MAG TPA: FkbM family methyltransferase [Phycisphaerae bacterium]|nr:FkbM family methyltransferase [Phycisphaerae bacterium]
MPRCLEFIRSLLKPRDQQSAKTSYSQCGEDLIVDYVLAILGVSLPRYVDIGANHPVKLSNTYLFYCRGARGVCVEPNPLLFEELAAARPRDVCLNVGVGASDQGEGDFYVMDPPSLGTFSQREAHRYERLGHKIRRVVKVPLVPVNTILREHCPDRVNYVSLDVEGLEVAILESWDFDGCRPEVFCIETVLYEGHWSRRKEVKVAELMKSRGYFVYADTNINTIFVDCAAWKGPGNCREDEHASL